MLVTLSKIGEVKFYLTGKNGFHVKIENEWFIVMDSCFRQNLKFRSFSLEQRLRSELRKSNPSPVSRAFVVPSFLHQPL